MIETKYFPTDDLVFAITERVAGGLITFENARGFRVDGEKHVRRVIVEIGIFAFGGFQLFFVKLAFTDVDVYPDHAYRRTIITEKNPSLGLYPANGSVRANHAKFDFIIFAGFNGSLDCSLHSLAVFGMKEAIECFKSS